MKVTLYTDGAARGNPEGPGGYGAILQYVDSKGTLHEREFSAGYKKTTNNRMELMAVIVGMEALTRPCQVEVVSDSKYVTDAFNQHWMDGWLKNNWKTSTKKPVKNVELLTEENGVEKTYYIAELKLDENVNIVYNGYEAQFGNKVIDAVTYGGGVYAEFDARNVKKIRFTIEIPQGQSAVGISEIAVMGNAT